MKIGNVIIHSISLLPIVQSTVGLYDMFSGLSDLMQSCITPDTSQVESLKNKAWRQIKKGACRIVPILGTGYSIYRLGRICHKKIIEIKSKNFESKTLENFKSQSEKVFNEIKDEEPVTMGQGEYIVFAENKDSIDEETYKKAHQIFLDNSPRKLKKEDCQKRHEIIAGKIKELNPNLKIAFIPRTLYELTYIERCIKEEIKSYESEKGKKENEEKVHKHGWNKCPRIGHQTDLLEPSKPKIFSDKDGENDLKNAKPINELFLFKKRDCWHLDSSTQVGKDDEYNKAKLVINTAWRLNNYMIKKFKPSAEGFTLKQLMDLTEEKIKFLKDYPKKENIKDIIDASGSCGPIEHFKVQGNVKVCDKREKVIKNAVKLDCSPISIHSHWIYRGSKFINDSVISKDGRCYSLSYGTSLLAGTCKDWNASALHYATGETTYAIPVPFDKIDTSPFYIPNQHPLPQLCGYGEVFHVRTGAWKGLQVGDLVLGFKGHTTSKSFYISEKMVEKETFIETFSKYKKKAVKLND